MQELIDLLTRLLTASGGKSSTEIQAALGKLQYAFRKLDTLFTEAEQAICPEYISCNKQRKFFSLFLQYNHPKLTEASQALSKIINDSATGNAINPAILNGPSSIITTIRDRVSKKLNELNNTTDSRGKVSRTTISSFLKQFSACLTAPLERSTPMIPNDIDEQFSSSLRALQPQIETAQQKLTAKGREQYSCFLSYAWGNSEHEQIVVAIAHQLERAGISVLFDRWADVPGKQIQHFVSKIDTANWVIIFG
jgi:TIR domain